MGKEAAQLGVRSLSGSVLREERGAEGNYCYLTLLGMLITDDGTALEDMLAEYLRLVKDKLESGMETRDITMERQAVVAALKLSDPDSRTFHKFIRFSPFSSGGGGNGEDWQIGVPYFLDDLLLEDDLHRYIENWALKDYDPNLPSAHAERAVYLGSKQRASEPQQNLATRPKASTSERVVRKK